MSRGSAVRFDVTGDALSRTTNLPPIGSWTIAAWVKLVVDLENYSVLWSFGNTSGGYFCVETNADGVTIELYDGSTDVDGATLTVGTWYHIATVIDGTGAGNFRAYLNGVLNITMAGNAGILGQEIRFGTPNDGFWSNEAVADARIWDVALSLAEIRAEMGSPAPVRRRDLNAWYECQPGRLTLDSSGRGRHMTVGGTLTAEAGPPMLALPRRRIVGKAAVATTSLLIPGPRLSQAILAR